MWLNTSNLSPQDGFLLALHEQLVDLQDYVYRAPRDTRESRYYFMVLSCSFSSSPPSSESPASSPFTPSDRFLNHVFRHRLVLEPNVMVWRLDVPLDPSDPHRFRAYLQFNRPIPEHTLHRFLNPTSDTPIHLRSIVLLDSYEFIHAIAQWKPLNPGIRAWCRFVHPIEPDFAQSETTLPFTESPHYTDAHNYQEKLRAMWTTKTLNALLDINYE